MADRVVRHPVVPLLPMDDTLYITSLYEIIWGSILIAAVMIMHGAGVVLTLRLVATLQRRAHKASFLYGMGTLVTATLLLVLVHLAEVVVWAAFLSARGAFPNISTANYYALMQYTTVSSSYSLPVELRLLGGLIPLSGLLTVAWTTSVLFLIAQPVVAQYSGHVNRSPPG